MVKWNMLKSEHFTINCLLNLPYKWQYKQEKANCSLQGIRDLRLSEMFNSSTISLPKWILFLWIHTTLCQHSRYNKASFFISEKWFYFLHLRDLERKLSWKCLKNNNTFVFVCHPLYVTFTHYISREFFLHERAGRWAHERIDYRNKEWAFWLELLYWITVFLGYAL